MHAAVVAPAKPIDTLLRCTVMPFVATATADGFVVFGAARDDAVRVRDQ
jgi:hypothetical protein